MSYLNLSDILNRPSLKLRQLTGQGGKIVKAEIHLPGLFIAGADVKLPEETVFVLSKIECQFLNSLHGGRLKGIIEGLSHFRPPCVIVTDGCLPSSEILKLAGEVGLVLCATDLEFNRFFLLFQDFLKFRLADRKKVHGTLVDVSGVGILLKGKSGIGKSECALDLIRKGHRLVGDDFIELIAYPEGRITGRSGAPTEETRFFMEIRGIGLIDVVGMYGISAVEEAKFVDVVVELKRFEERDSFDRLGFVFEKTEILGVELPFVKFPVIPGKNISTIVEALALKYISHRMGRRPERLIEEVFKLRMRDDKETT